MKLGKRILSVLLAVLMAFSCMSVGLYAFADDGSKAACDAEAESFVTIPVNRADIGGDVIWTKEGVQNTLDGMWNMFATMMNLAGMEINGKKVVIRNGLNRTAEDFVYQASTVSEIFSGYANLSHDEDETGLEKYPTFGDLYYAMFNTKVIADRLEQSGKKYDKVIAKIRAIEVTDEDKANGINDLDKLAEIEFTNLDFGFVSGSKNGFIDACLAVLRPVTALMNGENEIINSLGIDLNMFDTAEKRGIYSRIMPLLENIGLINMPTADEYLKNYLSVKDAGGVNTCLDEILRPIVDSAFENVIQPILDKPLDGMVDLIPRFAYVLNSGILSEAVNNVACAVYDIPDGETVIEITPQMVNSLITSMEFPVDEEGNDTIRFKAINWRIFSDCTTLETKKSSSDDYEYFVLRTGETDSAVVNMFYYVYEVMFADKKNYKAVRKVVETNFADDKDMKDSMLKSLDEMASMGRNPACGAFLESFGEPGKTKLPREKAVAQKRFNDIAGFEKYDDYIAYTSVYNEIVRGTNPPYNTVFAPTRTIERAMMVTILYRLAGEPYKAGNPHEKTPFTDITDTNAYYYDAACWALDKGITTETTFKPFNAVSREETAAFLFRYASENGLIYDENYKSVSINDYKDYSSIRPWAYEAMQWANFNGMITGTEQGYANPQGATQRVHASKILYGFGKNCDIGNFK